MAGVQETKVYDGPEGVVVRQEGTAFTQFHARTVINGKRKGRYYASARGAVAWLKKQAAK